MSYAILRTKKLKSFGEIAGSARHTFREIETLNADPSRLTKNENLQAHSADQVLALYREKMPEKVRKNAVLGVEYLITASPERFKDKDFNEAKYFNDAIIWLRERHGRENVVSLHVHRDESTPHLIAYVIPKDEKGALNARQFLGGKAKLSAMQTEFAKKVGEPHGLKRGIKGSKAKHQAVNRFYGQLNQAAKAALEYKPTKWDLFTEVLGFKSARYRAQQEAAALSAAAALEAKLDRERAKIELDSVALTEQELSRIREEQMTREQRLEVELDKLAEERTFIEKATIELTEQLNTGEQSKDKVKELTEELKASQTLTERLSRELERVQQELHNERHQQDNSHGRSR